MSKNKVIYAHPTKIKCCNCRGFNSIVSCSKEKGLIRYWMCRDCKTGQKTIGVEPSIP